ncbi:MAG: hypothetical protein V3T77_11350 [Planctomycetota bacterium]
MARSTFLILALVVWGAPLEAQTKESDLRELRQQLQELEKRLTEEEQRNDALQRDLETVRRQIFELIEGRGDREDTIDGLPQLPRSPEERRALRRGLPSQGWLGVLHRTHLGGYFDLEYTDEENEDRSFRQHRLVPFIFSDISEQIRFAAEIEFEDGGNSEDDGETKIEFATLDYVFSEAFAIRAGALLLPLGKFNLIHDSPTNDLTARPKVDRSVIPTTLSSSGIGFFGTFYPSEESRLDYEIYFVNNFRGLVEDSSSPTGFRSDFNTVTGLRGGRPSLSDNTNNSLALDTRVTFSPFIGSEIGLSSNIGKYDKKGDNALVIYAVDTVFQPAYFWPKLGGLEILGEFARAEISRNTLARASGVPGDMWGIYAQVNYHFMPGLLPEKLPEVFGDDSTFTGVVRLGHTDLDGVRSERLTLGLNFRPIESTVFKVSYQFNFDEWDHGDANDAFLFSIASYF